jgi:hypothetical protein
MSLFAMVCATAMPSAAQNPARTVDPDDVVGQFVHEGDPLSIDGVEFFPCIGACADSPGEHWLNAVKTENGWTVVLVEHGEDIEVLFLMPEFDEAAGRERLALAASATASPDQVESLADLLIEAVDAAKRLDGGGGAVGPSGAESEAACVHVDDNTVVCVVVTDEGIYVLVICREDTGGPWRICFFEKRAI